MERAWKVHEIKRPCTDFGEFRFVSRRRAVGVNHTSSLDAFGDVVRPCRVFL